MLTILPQSELWDNIQEVMRDSKMYATKNTLDQINAILWALKYGIPWRQMPKEFGAWNTVYKRFRTLCEHQIFEKILFLCVKNFVDTKCHSIDSTHISCHKHSAGALKGLEIAIGKSRGGKTTKIHLRVDSKGLPVQLTITGGHVHDSKEALKLLGNGPTPASLAADKAYDSREIRDGIEELEYTDDKTGETKNSRSVIPKRGIDLNNQRR